MNIQGLEPTPLQTSMEELLAKLPKPTHTIDGLTIVPPKGAPANAPANAPTEEGEVVALEAMSEDIAREVLGKLTTLLKSDDLNIQDLKDITTMSKDVSGYLQKANGAKPRSSDAGLGSFLSRLKA